MPIPQEYQAIEIYHFVHLDNLESMCRYGLLSCNEQQRRGIRHRSVALAGIQHRRAQMAVPVGPGGVVHDYIPFYFCKRSPMLLRVLNTKNVDQQFLVYLCLPLTILEHQPCVFTDSSANRNDPPRFFEDPAQLEELKWPEINSLKWASATEELKQQKMAELLVHRALAISSIPRVVVWNEPIADAVREIFSRCGVANPEIDFDTKHYYTKYPSSKLDSLVTGPFFTKRSYEDTVGRVLGRIGQVPAARFPSLFELRDALRADLRAVPEIGELVGLPTDNPMHTHDLGTHTRQVAERLRNLSEFQALNSTDQLITELAAFFHDAGKGPKARWQATGGKYRNDRDHPIQALPMLERVLTKDVARMTRRSARLLCKLVCYHDLIGDIFGSDRDEQQLVEILDDQRELDMLIALAKADVLAVHADWWDDARVRDLRVRISGQLGAE